MADPDADGPVGALPSNADFVAFASASLGDADLTPTLSRVAMFEIEQTITALEVEEGLDPVDCSTRATFAALAAQKASAPEIAARLTERVLSMVDHPNAAEETRNQLRYNAAYSLIVTGRGQEGEKLLEEIPPGKLNARPDHSVHETAAPAYVALRQFDKAIRASVWEPDTLLVLEDHLTQHFWQDYDPDLARALLTYLEKEGPFCIQVYTLAPPDPWGHEQTLAEVRQVIERNEAIKRDRVSQVSDAPPAERHDIEAALHHAEAGEIDQALKCIGKIGQGFWSDEALEFCLRLLLDKGDIGNAERLAFGYLKGLRFVHWIIFQEIVRVTRRPGALDLTIKILTWAEGRLDDGEDVYSGVKESEDILILKANVIAESGRLDQLLNECADRSRDAGASYYGGQEARRANGFMHEGAVDQLLKEGRQAEAFALAVGTDHAWPRLNALVAVAIAGTTGNRAP